MHSLTFYPLGNADTCLLETAGGHMMLFDYANTRNCDDAWDRRVDLPALLRERLADQGRNDFDVVAFTHLDLDHIAKASEFFYLEHSARYQGDGRVKITELWVPAAAICETRNDLSEEAKIVQAEARYRLRNGAGVRVFSSPKALDDWFAQNGLDPSARAALITDAGTIVPGMTLESDGVEFFVHSPFAYRLGDTLIERNSCSLVFQVTFLDAGQETKVILAADSPYDVLTDIVNISKAHGNESRLSWNLFKLPHHCSYLSLGPDKGTEVMTPVDAVHELFEAYSSERPVVVSPSDPIPTEDTVQPPHRQAANYYRDLCASADGDFVVTMEHPTKSSPEPLVVKIDGLGATVVKRVAASSVAITQRPAPRAG